MIGIPEEDHQQIFNWTHIILGFGDPDLGIGLREFVRAITDTGAYAHELAESRRCHPSADLTTSLVQAEADGERLTSAEVASPTVVGRFRWAAGHHGGRDRALGDTDPLHAPYSDSAN